MALLRALPLLGAVHGRDRRPCHGLRLRVPARRRPGNSRIIQGQAADLGGYLATHGYMLVRPCGGFALRGASGMLPALEHPFSIMFQRMTGNSFASQCSWERAVQLAGLWDDIGGCLSGTEVDWASARLPCWAGLRWPRSWALSSARSY